jgi:hypothetical protein
VDGQTISEFGTPISQIAIPWLAIKNLNASAFEVQRSERFSFCRSCSSRCRRESGSTAAAPLGADRRRCGRALLSSAFPWRTRSAS